MFIEYLPLDMYSIIFSYLFQNELLSILLTNKFIYNQIMKYINNTKFSKSLIHIAEGKCFISLINIINDKKIHLGDNSIFYDYQLKNI